MIQAVKEFSSKLKLHALFNGKQPLNREVQIDSGRSRKDIASRIAERTDRSRFESGGREPFTDSLAERTARQRGFGDQVGEVAPYAAERIVLSRADSEREPALRVKNAGGLPSSNQGPEQGVVFRRRQLPQVVEHEALRDVEIRH